MGHFLPYLILLFIYIPFGFILRLYIFEDYYKPHMIEHLFRTLGYTMIGVFVSIIFSMAYLKVCIDLESNRPK